MDREITPGVEQIRLARIIHQEITAESAEPAETSTWRRKIGTGFLTQRRMTQGMRFVQNTLDINCLSAIFALSAVNNPGYLDPQS
jgi:hypothetical protein